MVSSIRRPSSSASADEEQRQEPAPSEQQQQPRSSSSSSEFYNPARPAHPHHHHQLRVSPAAQQSYSPHLQHQPHASYAAAVPPPPAPRSSPPLPHQQEQEPQAHNNHMAAAAGYAPAPPTTTAVTPSPYHPQQQQPPQRYRFPIPSYLYSNPDGNSSLADNDEGGAAALAFSHGSKSVAGCTCKKSRCLKLYCQCFAGSTTCGPTCRCDDCRNLPEFALLIDEARRSVCNRRPLAFDRKQAQQQAQQQHYNSAMAPSSSALASISRVGCKCRRSNCLKKYCECFAASTYCSDRHCKCLNCGNTTENAKVHHKNNPEPPQPMVAIEQQPYRQQSHVVQVGHGRFVPQAYPPVSGQVQHPPKPQPQPQHPFATETHQQRRQQPGQPREREERQALQQQQQQQPQAPITDVPRASPASFSTPKEADAEAIMAAVAMTELFHSGPATTAKESTQRENATPTSELTASLAKAEIDKIKRKPAQEQKQDGTNKKPKFVSSPRSPEDDEVRHAVSASQSFTSVESRNPSPGVQHQHPPPPSSYYAASTTPAPPARYPHPQQWVQQPPQPQRQHQYHLIDGRYYTRGDPHGHGHRMMPAQQAAYRASPPHPYYPTPPADGDTGVGGLPKSLSFRKICSRCGKTRGEHGELGFGHKCQYRDCGRCGAAQRWHVSAGQPMGVACRLTVPQGALPGAAAAYERKIRDLATRAELQRVARCRERQQEAATAAMTAEEPAASTVVPPKTTSVQ